MVSMGTNKKRFIALIGIILAITIVIAVLFFKKQSQNEKTFEYEGTLNCQPILTPEEAELCRRAEAANYPYIVY